MKNINLLLAASSFFILTGCQSVSDIRQRTPVLNVNSPKNIKVINDCVTESLEKLFKANKIYSEPTNTGYQISIVLGVALGKDTAAVVDIATIPNGSEIKLYSQILMGERKVVDAINECK